MKRILLLALCALLSLNAGARTLYVDAKRPNNNGNGLSKAKAKKTIQAAINVAKKGDTILVLPGTYAPIQTKNKKITIKSTKGAKKTKIVSNAGDDLLADLSKHVRRHNSAYNYDYTEYSGRATTMSGFLFDGQNSTEAAIVGGSPVSCTIQGFRGSIYATSPLYSSFLSRCLVRNNYVVTGSLFADCVVKATIIQSNACEDFDQGCFGIGTNTKFVDCSIRKNTFCWGFREGTTLLNCRIIRNTLHICSHSGDAIARDSHLTNCLIADNEGACGFGFRSSELLNCTIARNTVRSLSADKFSDECKFYNCILWNNYSQSYWSESVPEWNEAHTVCEYKTVFHPYPEKLHNVDSGNVYKNTDKTNRNPKFTSAYKLKKGSYCIDKGKLTKKQKKQVGTKDLAGKKRIKGKAIDRGCYEY